MEIQFLLHWVQKNLDFVTIAGKKRGIFPLVDTSRFERKKKRLQPKYMPVPNQPNTSKKKP